MDDQFLQTHEIGTQPIKLKFVADKPIMMGQVGRIFMLSGLSWTKNSNGEFDGTIEFTPHNGIAVIKNLT